MNLFDARIVRIEREGNLHIVGFDTGEAVLWMMGLELPKVSIGERVRLGFKSTSVTVAMEKVARISFSNALAASVTRITKGKLLCSLLLATHAGEVEAIMTNRAFEQLDAKEGMAATVYIKASELAIKEVLGD